MTTKTVNTVVLLFVFVSAKDLKVLKASGEKSTWEHAAHQAEMNLCVGMCEIALNDNDHIYS